MGRAKDEAGNIWETDARGNPVRLIQAAQGNPMNNPLVDPRLAPQTQKAQSDAATAQATAPYAGPKAQADAAAADAQARIAEAQAGVANAKTQTELETAKVNLAKTQAELQQLQSGKGSALDALQTQVDRVGELYRQRLQGGMPNAVNAVVPDPMQPNVAAFGAAAQGLTNPFMAAFRIPGVGSQSDTELRQFLAANTPSPNDPDAVIEEKLRNIQTRIDAERAARGQKAAQGQAQAPQAPANPDQIGLATGKTRDVVDPVLKATAGRVGRMVADGVPGDKIKAFLQRSGIDPAGTNIDEALQFRQSPDFKKWQRQNPGKPYPIGPDFYTNKVPMSATRSLLNSAAADNTAGALVAAPLAAGNAVTGGYLNDIVGATGGNAQEAQNGLDLMRAQHPVSSLAGDLAGYGAFEAALGRIPGANSLMATRMGRRGADALYGGFSGSGENDQDRLGGAVTGALVNTGAGMAGRGLQRGVGGALTGVKSDKLGYLNDAGIPLTIGQIGRGADNTLGSAVGGLEDRAAGIPIFDAIINSARRRGEEGFNSAAFREAGGSGVTGARGVGELQNNVNNAYNFLDGVNLPVDPQFTASQQFVKSNLPNLPAFGPEIGKSLEGLDRVTQNGFLSGRDFQSALRSVKSNRSSLKGKEFSDDAINSLGDVEANLLDLALRQGPPSTALKLAQANRLNKQFKTITGALDNGPAQARNELFSPSRLDTASRASQRKFGGQTSSIKGERPFYELTKAGMDIMPNQVPDSGTAGRALMYSALFGGGVGGSLGAGLGAVTSPNDPASGAIEGGAQGGSAALAIPFALAALYSKPGQKALQKALLGSRPAKIDLLGDILKKNPRLAGMFGSTLGRDFVYQPELGQ